MCWAQELNNAFRVLNLAKDIKPSILKEAMGEDLKWAQCQLMTGEAALADDYKLLKDEKYANFLPL